MNRTRWLVLGSLLVGGAFCAHFSISLLEKPTAGGGLGGLELSAVPVGRDANIHGVAVRVGFPEPLEAGVTHLLFRKPVSGDWEQIASLEGSGEDPGEFLDSGLPEVQAYQYDLYTSQKGRLRRVFSTDKLELDPDRDGIAEVRDNCPGRYNSAQTDVDRDGVGDDCDDPEELECAPLPPPAVVNRVEIDCDLAEPASICDGADVEAALIECSAQGGCILQAHNTSYSDVAILIANGISSTGYPCLQPPATVSHRSSCLDLPFEHGLVIQGHGPDSVFESPLWEPPYRPMPALQVWKRPGLALRLRHLTLDGRKGSQRPPTPGINDSNTWWHHGFESLNEWNTELPQSSGGCLHDVVVRGFMTSGIRLSSTAGWIVEGSRIEDIGCYKDLTPCRNLDLPSVSPILGEKSPGSGICIGWHSDDLTLRDNQIKRVAKYSIGLKATSDGRGCEGGCMINRPRVVGNRILEAGSIGLFVAGVAEGEFVGNLIASTQRPGVSQTWHYYDTFGVSVMGLVENTLFSDNQVLDSAGLGLAWHAEGEGNAVRDSLISGSCRKKNPLTCNTGRPRECYAYPDVFIRGRGRLELENLAVLETGCRVPLAAHGDREMRVVIQGGIYEGGVNSSCLAEFLGVDATLLGDLRFVDAASTSSECVVYAASGSGPACGVVADTVTVENCLPALAVSPDALPDVLICSEDPETCDAICTGEAPPDWCLERLAMNRAPG